MVPKVKSHVPLRDERVAPVSTPAAPVDWLGAVGEATTVAAGVEAAEVGLGVAGTEVGVGDEAGVGVSVGVPGVSVTTGRRTMVGVDEAATAPLKTAPQPVSRISKINRPIKVIVLSMGTPYCSRTEFIL
jgi:hypothetical protein